MTDHRDEGSGEQGPPVPRDLPDQQAGAGDDPWDVDESDPTEPDADAEPDAADPDTPDTDEAGTGRRGAPHASGVRPGQPVPDEPPG
ncbi:hypothetical protein ACK389_11835 [Streptomyces antibioticus]|uniref:hypothetical protein n=1 Tax=Streptomyces antibioticus TaxID=1890 RepID=UPI0033CA76B5